jgi:hypothetical protein
MKLAELAACIDAHLKRFEQNKRINRLRKRGTLLLSTYFGAGALANGRYVSVRYVSYHGHTSLSKVEAEKYLAWLDAGNVGTHFSMRTPRPAAKGRKKLS